MHDYFDYARILCMYVMLVCLHFLRSVLIDKYVVFLIFMFSLRREECSVLHKFM